MGQFEDPAADAARTGALRTKEKLIKRNKLMGVKLIL
jgi:hypothetical protein